MAIVRNTFLEFEEDLQDPWLITAPARRQQTDSIVERSSQSLRHDLEQNIVATLRSHLGPPLASCNAPRPAPLPPQQRPKASEEKPEPTPPVATSTSSPDDSSNDEEDETANGMPLLPSTLLTDLSAGCDERLPSSASAESKKVQGPSGLAGCTTVMVRNVPGKYTQRKFMREINGAGFLGRYDFIYLPMDARRRSNRGFAFLNLESPSTAELFHRVFHGERMRHFAAEKALEVVPADIQGFDANAEHYMSAKAVRRSRDSCTRPMFLREIAKDSAKDGVAPGFQGSAAPLQQPQQAKPLPAAAPLAAAPRGEAGADRKPWPVSLAAAALAAQLQQLQLQVPQVLEPLPQMVPQQAPLVQRFCPFCGQPKKQEHSFCPFCGAKALPRDQLQA